MRRQTLRTPNIEDCVVWSVRKEEIPICFDFSVAGVRGKWSSFFRVDFSLLCRFLWWFWRWVTSMDTTGVDDDGMGVDLGGRDRKWMDMWVCVL